MESRRELQPPGEAAGDFRHQSLRRIRWESKPAPRFRNEMSKVKCLGMFARHDIPRLSPAAPRPCHCAEPPSHATGTTGPSSSEPELALQFHFAYQRKQGVPMKETPC